MPSRFLTSPLVEQYQRYRTAGRKLNHKIIDAFMSETVFDAAVRTLELGKKKHLTLDSEDDLDVLMDYGLYEIPPEGKNLVEHYAAKIGGRNRTERDLLEAMIRAKTGLFKVEHLLAARYQLSLRELTDGNRLLSVIDIGFSQSSVESYVFFFRPIELAKFTMTSGIAFVFPAEMERELIERWEQWDRSDRYVQCFKLNKRKGIPVAFE